MQEIFFWILHSLICNACYNCVFQLSKKKLSVLGVEPRLQRPQRWVLTTRRHWQHVIHVKFRNFRSEKLLDFLLVFVCQLENHNDFEHPFQISNLISREREIFSWSTDKTISFRFWTFEPSLWFLKHPFPTPTIIVGSFYS